MTMNGDRVTPIETATGKADLAEALEKSHAAFALVDAMWDEVKTTRAIADSARTAANRAADKASECLAAIQRRSLPPMRAELPSSIDPRELKAELRQAARDGEKRTDTTAEAQVEAVLERVELIRKGRLFNKLIWLAVAGAGSIAAERIISALIHH